MWSFLKLSMMISTMLVPSFTPGGSMVMLRMRSVRSQLVAPSNVAPAIPAAVILRKSLRVSLPFLTKQERTTQQCDLQAERTGCHRELYHPGTLGGLLK